MANIIVIILLSSILFNICVYHHFRHFHHFPRWWWWRLQNTTMWSPVIIPMTRGYYISYHHRHDYHHCHHRHHRHHCHYRKSASSSTSSSEIIANQSPFTLLKRSPIWWETPQVLFSDSTHHLWFTTHKNISISKIFKHDTTKKISDATHLMWPTMTHSKRKSVRRISKRWKWKIIWIEIVHKKSSRRQIIRTFSERK